MQVAKIKLETIIQELPDMIEIEEVMYRLYFLEKIEEGEEDIHAGRVMPHNQVVERLSQKWRT